MHSEILYGGSTALPNIRGHYHRPRIDKLLDELLDRYLIVVTAGAGSGKTHAISAYLHNVTGRVFWFQLSQLDNNPMRFWEEFVYVIGLQNRETAAQLEQLGFPETLLKFDKFLHVLAMEIYSQEQVIFMFDDFHLIQDELILRFAQNLIFAKLENFCIIINTRVNLNLSFMGMFSNDLAGLITAGDLYFTLDETWEYLKWQGVSLSRREIEKVQAITDGWPLALYLVGLSIKKGGMVSKDPIAGAMPMIFDMIGRELFAEYPPQIQNFLIRASLFNSFPEGLVKTLAGEHIDAVTESISDNMFIYINPYTGHYNFHHLFLEFLSKQQKDLTQEEITNTYLKAARWYAANDWKIEALDCYDKCGHYDEMLDIMFNFGVAIFSKTTADFYISLIDKLPVELIENNPILHFHRAGLLCNNAKVQPAVTELIAVIEKLEGLPPTQANSAILGELCCMLGLINLGAANYDFITQFKKASEYLPNGSAMIDSSGAALNTRYAIMLSDPAPGELKRMEEAMFCAMPYASETMHGYGQGLEYLASAEAAYFTGDMKKAAKNAHEAVYRAREGRVADVVSSGYFLLMRVETANGNYEGIVSNWERMKSYVDGLEDKWNFNGVPDVAEGWINLLFGNTDSVASWLVDETLADTVLAPYSMGIERTIKARHLLKVGKYYELLAWLGQSEKLARQYKIWLVILDMLICKAIAFHHIGDEAQSIAALREAYEIAHGNNLVMQFVEYVNDIRAVIYSARRSKLNTVPRVWLNEIYTKAATYEKHLRNIRSRHQQKPGQVLKPLVKVTKREMEMLGHLCQGMTNAEIAGACFVTISAVKKTLNNIYIKLGATNRADAVRIAMQMGLNE